MQNAGGVYYLHAEHPWAMLGTSLNGTNVGTDGSGNFVGRVTYYPFGSVRTVEGSVPTDYGFTGQKIDASDAPNVLWRQVLRSHARTVNASGHNRASRRQSAELQPLQLRAEQSGSIHGTDGEQDLRRRQRSEHVFQPAAGQS